MRCNHASAGRSHHVTLLNKIGLKHILNGVPLLADGCCQTVNADRSTTKLFDHGEEQAAIHVIESIVVNTEHIQRLTGNLAAYLTSMFDITEVAHAP